MSDIPEQPTPDAPDDPDVEDAVEVDDEGTEDEGEPA